MAKEKPSIVPQITFKSLLDPIKDIDKRNKKFASLSNEGKRLEIAWEGLKLIIAGMVTPSGIRTTGGSRAVAFWDENLKRIADKKGKNSKALQQAFLAIPECEVCERGLLTLSKIRIGSAVLIDERSLTRDLISTECGDNPISRDGFDLSSLELMEAEYESREFKHPYNNRTIEKMANILCNVLVNGDFDIYDKTDYLTPKTTKTCTQQKK